MWYRRIHHCRSLQIEWMPQGGMELGWKSPKHGWTKFPLPYLKPRDFLCSGFSRPGISAMTVEPRSFAARYRVVPLHFGSYARTSRLSTPSRGPYSGPWGATVVNCLTEASVSFSSPAFQDIYTLPRKHSTGRRSEDLEYTQSGHVKVSDKVYQRQAHSHHGTPDKACKTHLTRPAGPTLDMSAAADGRYLEARLQRRTASLVAQRDRFIKELSVRHLPESLSGKQ